MNELWSQVVEYLSLERLLTASRAVILVVAGLVLARLVASALRRVLDRRLEPQQVMLFRRIAYYAVLGLFLVAALHQLGFNLGVILGAAGVLSMAVGFASQTSASNIISGLFLIAERPFGIGDVIQAGGTTGEVLSIDLLSVKLRTFDNLYVRIPNETLIKSEVKTLTRFPIRRVDLAIGIAYKEDLSRVRRILLDVADANPLSLEEPQPLFIIKGFGDSSVDLQFSVWTARENFLELKNGIQEQIKLRFDAEGVEIPFPHVSIYAGSRTDPLPVRILPA